MTTLSSPIAAVCASIARVNPLIEIGDKVMCDPAQFATNSGWASLRCDIEHGLLGCFLSPRWLETIKEAVHRLQTNDLLVEVQQDEVLLAQFLGQ